MSSASQLRARARESLGGGVFSPAWLYALLVGLILTGISSLASAIPVLPLLIAGPLSVGAAGYFLALHRKKQGATEDLGALFHPFSADLANTLLTGLLKALYTFLWSLLFVIPGIVKAYSYAMAPYIKADHPEYTATQAIDESRRMMYGHKMRLFGLHLSFLGWILLSTCCCGITFLWVDPYIRAAEAAFYEELKTPTARFTQTNTQFNPTGGSQ